MQAKFAQTKKKKEYILVLSLTLKELILFPERLRISRLTFESRLFPKKNKIQIFHVITRISIKYENKQEDLFILPIFSILLSARFSS